MLQDNKDNLNRIIPNMAVISENTARISEEFKHSLDEAGEGHQGPFPMTQRIRY